MQVRVFESIDMASGLKMVKKELGPDALILSTKTVRNGKLGLLSKPMFEITAAIDSAEVHEAVSEKKPSNPSASGPSLTTEPKGTYTKNNDRLYKGFRQVVDESIEQYLQHDGSNQVANQQPSDPMVPVPPNTKTDGLQDEVNELKDLVKGLAGQINQLSSNHDSAPRTQPQVQPASTNINIGQQDVAMFHDNSVVSLLLDRGVNLSTSRHIAGILRKTFEDDELSDPSKITAEILKAIEQLVSVKPPEWDRQDQQHQHRMALVGPTGVGKTTTLAKLAASYLTNYSNSVALITIDTYRIAAVEQLKVYGEIMRLPVEVVISPEQLDKVLEKHSDKELILIDTAGRSPKDSLCIDELSSFLRPELNIDKHLVVSAATRENELYDIVARFGTLDISNTIFTKLDECSNLGVLLNVQARNNSPLSYVTNGQRVPEDLLEISPKIIAELIMSLHEGSTDD